LAGALRDEAADALPERPAEQAVDAEKSAGRGRDVPALDGLALPLGRSGGP